MRNNRFKLAIIIAVCILAAISFYFYQKNSIAKIIKKDDGLETSDTKISYSDEEGEINKILDKHRICTIDSDCVEIYSRCNSLCDCPETLNKKYKNLYEEVLKEKCPHYKYIGMSCHMTCSKNRPKCIKNKCIMIYDKQYPSRSS